MSFSSLPIDFRPLIYISLHEPRLGQEKYLYVKELTAHSNWSDEEKQYKLISDYECRSFEQFYNQYFNKFHLIRSIIIDKCSRELLQKLASIRDDLTGLLNVKISTKLTSMPPIHINTKILYVDYSNQPSDTIYNSIKGDIETLYLYKIAADEPLDETIIQCQPTTLKLYIHYIYKHLDKLYIPKSVKHFRMYSDIRNNSLNKIKYPDNLESIKLRCMFYSMNKILCVKKQPSLIKNLINESINFSIFPRNLKTLKLISYNYDNDNDKCILVRGNLPYTLQNLYYLTNNVVHIMQDGICILSFDPNKSFFLNCIHHTLRIPDIDKMFNSQKNKTDLCLDYHINRHYTISSYINVINNKTIKKAHMLSSRNILYEGPIDFTSNSDDIEHNDLPDSGTNISNSDTNIANSGTDASNNIIVDSSDSDDDDIGKVLAP